MRYPQPDNEDAFEQMCLRFYRKLWKNESLDLYGKRGEDQHGFDIYDPLGLQPIRAVQCKHRESTKTLLPSEIDVEVQKAESAPFSFDHYVIATTAKKSKHAQNKILELNARSLSRRKFTVEIHYWENICERLDEFGRISAEFILHGQDLGNELLASIIKEPIIAASVQRILSIGNLPNLSGAFSAIDNLFKDRRIELARYELQKIKDPNSTQLSLDERYQFIRLQAKLALEDGDYKAASNHFKDAYKLRPDLDQAKQNLVLAHSLVNDSKEAYGLSSEYIAAGMTNPDLLSKLIESATSREQIDEHLKLIETHLKENENINLALAHKLMSWGDIAGSMEAAKRALAIAPDSAHAHLIVAMTQHNSAFKENWPARRLALQDASAHYIRALEIARKENYTSLLPEILINLGATQVLLGDYPSGATSYRDAVSVAKNPAMYAINAVSAALNQEDYQAAEKYLDLLDTKTNDGLFLSTATKFYNSNVKSHRLRCIEQLNSLADESWPRALECRFLAIQWALILEEPEIAKACISEGFASAYPFQAQVALAWIALRTGYKEESTNHAKHAFELSDGNTCHAQELRILAKTFEELSQYENAITLLERLTISGMLNEDMKSLIICAQKLGRHDLLLRICRELRATGEQDEKLRKLEIQLLSRYAPEAGLSVVDELIRTSKKPSYFNAYKNVLALRLGRNELVNLDMSQLPNPNDLPPGEAFLVITPLVQASLDDVALKFLYDQLRIYFNKEQAHSQFISFSLLRGDKTTIRAAPTKVETGCAVLLETNGVSRWVVIENESPEVTRNEFATSNELVQRLLGHSIGELIELPTPFGQAEKATITEIQTKYVRMLQDCMQHFRERFPEANFLHQMHLGEGDQFNPAPLIDALKDRRQHLDGCFNVYLTTLCPLNLLAHKLGISELETILALADYPDGMVRCCETTPQEFDGATNEYILSKPIVLDLSAIITLTLIDGWQHLGTERRYLVSRSTKEIVEQWIAESQIKHSERRSLTAHEHAGKLVVHERTPEQDAAKSALLEVVRDRLKDLECQESTSVAAVEPTRRKSYEDVIGYHHLESLCLAQDLGATFWADDLMTSVVAKFDFGLQSVWTQLELKFLSASGRLSLEDYNLLSSKLIAQRYVATIWNPDIVIRAGEYVGWDSEKAPFKQCIELLSTSPIPRLDKAKIALTILRLFRNSNCSPLRQSGVIQAILTAVRDHDAVQWMLNNLAEVFGTDVASVIFLRPELIYWLATKPILSF